MFVSMSTFLWTSEGCCSTHHKSDLKYFMNFINQHISEPWLYSITQLLYPLIQPPTFLRETNDCKRCFFGGHAPLWLAQVEVDKAEQVAEPLLSFAEVKPIFVEKFFLWNVKGGEKYFENTHPGCIWIDDIFYILGICILIALIAWLIRNRRCWRDMNYRYVVVSVSRVLLAGSPGSWAGSSGSHGHAQSATWYGWM